MPHGSAQHSVQVVEYISVPETQHPVVERLQFRGSLSFARGPSAVLAVVDFHDQAVFPAAEVRDVAGNRLLARVSDALDSPVPPRSGRPEAALRVAAVRFLLAGSVMLCYRKCPSSITG